MLKIISGFILIFISTPVVNALSCNNKNIAENISTFYISAAPGSSVNFKGLVELNKSLLSSDSLTIICMDKLGTRLKNKGLKAYDPDAYKRVMGIQPTQLASSVANSINSDAVNLYQIGTELKWLASVLPSAASGDFSRYLVSV